MNLIQVFRWNSLIAAWKAFLPENPVKKKNNFYQFKDWKENLAREASKPDPSGVKHIKKGLKEFSSLLLSLLSEIRLRSQATVSSAMTSYC